MIIQSDQTRMGAARSCDSSSYCYTRYQEWNPAGGSVLSYETTTAKRQSIRTKSENGKLAQSLTTAGDSGEDAPEESGTQISGDRMKNLMEQMNASSSVRRNSLQDMASNLQRIRRQTISYLLDLLFGRTSRIRLDQSDNETDLADYLTSESSSLSGSGGSYYSCFYYSERETTCFDAQGTAVTADGREIPFSINLEMSRSFTQAAETAVDFGQPRLCDPLVINLSGGCAGVTGQKFFFDLDADGTEEEISSLDAGSGYLALDKNGDGIINDGSELFGTASGNGFADLSSYDQDGNGWIDEADEIFSKLRIWTKDENGKDQLLTLAETGVGAIYLVHESTDFSLNDPTTNETNAVIRETGIFLYENGASGTVQQIDLAT